MRPSEWGGLAAWLLGMVVIVVGMFIVWKEPPGGCDE